MLMSSSIKTRCSGVPSWVDRFVITGTWHGICNPKAMAMKLGARDIRPFDFPRRAEALREELPANAERHNPALGQWNDAVNARRFG